MPLPPNTDREHLHTRSIAFQGFRREDSLFDIEAHMTDVKSYGFKNEHRGEIKAGEPLHDMWLRVTLDEDFLIREIDAVTDAGPYGICPGAGPNYKRLVGKRMSAGWTRTVREAVGGVEGCTHLSETLIAMGTVAFQTLYPYLAKRRESKPRSGRPPLLNTCHAFRSDGEVTRRLWPEYYDGPSDSAPREAQGGGE
jgi:hypothetical protein